MKKSMFLLVACMVFGIIHAQESAKNEESTNTGIEFNKLVHDFGTVIEPDGILECDFIVTNNSDQPLVLTRVSAGCGCTVPNWTKEPIKAGEKGFVKVTFDPKGRKGNFTKSLTVYTSDDSSPTRLSVKGSIEQASVAQK
ncbi:MAG: DUF1573 domain-containing protein [Tannerella sp.]|jgi:hypothetical protein|nr:DUF1573 domain-containing protein [Tannerella sp.]